jgi:MPBQ/MSBQ methyltransferase
MASTITQEHRAKIIDYYVQAGLDYAFWSKEFNMHFGFGHLGKLFQRENMLNAMSDKVIARLRIENSTGTVADFGCGTGATMRRAAIDYPSVDFVGFTIVPWQIQKGEELNTKKLKLRFLLEDYHSTSLEGSSLEGIYAIESACYSPENLHSRFFYEAHRVLQSGKRLVIADGFLKVPASALGEPIGRIYNSLCKNWALPGMMNIDDTLNHLRTAGFRHVSLEEVSWNVAPSVLHVPFVILRFLISKLIRKQPLSSQSIRNLKGSFLTLLLGLCRRKFGYYLITATK